MNQARYVELMSNDSLSLTEEEIKEGWHFCSEWDGLLINSEDEEAKFCTCFAETAPTPASPQGSDDSRPEIAGAGVGE